MEKLKVDGAKAYLEAQIVRHKEEQLLHALADILIIEEEQDPIEKRELLACLIRTLKSLGLTEENAIIKIRTFTSNSEILACLNANPETSLTKN